MAELAETKDLTEAIMGAATAAPTTASFLPMSLTAMPKAISLAAARRSPAPPRACCRRHALRSPKGEQLDEGSASTDCAALSHACCLSCRSSYIVCMPKPSKVLLLVGVLLILITTGLVTILGLVYLDGRMTGLAADGEYGMMYVAAGVIFASLSPSLLLPYVILFWRKPGRVVASLASAIICGAFYPPLLLVLLVATSGLKLDPGEGFAGWAVYSVLSLIPGTGLALLGTYFGQGLRSRSSAVRSQSQPE